MAAYPFYEIIKLINTWEEKLKFFYKRMEEYLTMDMLISFKMGQIKKITGLMESYDLVL